MPQKTQPNLRGVIDMVLGQTWDALERGLPGRVDTIQDAMEMLAEVAKCSRKAAVYEEHGQQKMVFHYKEKAAKLVERLWELYPVQEGTDV